MGDEKDNEEPREKIVKDIKRATRKHYSSEDKIRIVLAGLRGEELLSCAAVRAYCRASNQGAQAGIATGEAIEIPDVVTFSEFVDPDGNALGFYDLP